MIHFMLLIRENWFNSLCITQIIFFAAELEFLKDQLENYIADVHQSADFAYLKGINARTQKMVEIRKNDMHPLVYCLITLVLILTIATATVERVFSAMNIVKKQVEKSY